MADLSYPEDAIPSLYGEHASWFHLLSAPVDYLEEAEWVLAQARALTTVQKMLELGSGGGNLASHVPASIELVLSDLSPQMLDLSRTINPEREHVAGDMRTLRIDRRFDCVLIHDAIDYMLTTEDLGQAFQTVAAHTRPGGVAVIQPDHVLETFAPSTSHGGHDDGARGLRYVEWTWDPNPDDTTCEFAYACILRDADGTTRAVHDRHRAGLFPRATWTDTLSSAGFDVHSIVDPWDREVFIGVRDDT